MKTISFITLFAGVVAGATAMSAPASGPSNSIAQAEASLAAREQRVQLLRDELKSLDSRIETRMDTVINALAAIGDSKDTRTKVARMKERTIGALKNTINYYRGKRAALQEELRRPTLRLTEEQKQRGIAVFDARIEKRVAQILKLQKSLPTEKDYERYKATGGNWWGTEYAVNPDYRQNQRVTTVTNSQRKENEEGLRRSIARLEQQNRALRASNGPADEIARNEALITERRKQLATVLAPVETPTRRIGSKEAADLDSALNTTIGDLRREFDTLFARYHAFLQEVSAVNVSREALATAKAGR